MNSIKHVAIIMDGNGRWGDKNKKTRNLGHKAGLTTIEKIIKETVKKKLSFSLYMLSRLKIGKDQKERFDFYLIFLKSF